MTKVKICGIRFFDDGYAAIQAGADYIGFNFYSKSLRCVEPEVCKKVISLLRAQNPNVKFVGVFVNSETDYIKDVRRYCSLDLIQLHGDESSADLAQMGPFAYKAFRGIPDRLDEFTRKTAPAFLLDAASTLAYGGTGVPADWSTAAKLAVEYPLFLAGGLNPENVKDAILQVRPWGVDVASGVETAPGVKDAKKMNAFIKAVRLADQASLASENNQTQLENT
jgi:phosphoribosylanthranilate isomerase